MSTHESTIVYLSGQMSGLNDHGDEKFHQAASHLRDLGYIVINPCEFAGGNVFEDQLSRDRLLHIDFDLLSHCDAIVLLDNWHRSKGSKAELIYASEVGIPAYCYEEDKGVGIKVVAKNWRIDITFEPNRDNLLPHQCQSDPRGNHAKTR